MLNVNFVPDDYVQSNESRRTNLMYLILFGLVMAGLSGAFLTIKVRQRAIAAKERYVDEQMAEAKAAIAQFEQLEQRRAAMMKTALTTAELQEPVPRSVLLAALTNELPSGVSLVKLEIEQQEPKNRPYGSGSNTPAQTKYQQARDRIAAAAEAELSPEKRLQTHISMEGVAPSDVHVADYIGNLSCSSLLKNVALVESKEKENDQSKFRYFKLTAMLRKDIHVTAEDIREIREKGKRSAYRF